MHFSSVVYTGEREECRDCKTQAGGSARRKGYNERSVSVNQHSLPENRIQDVWHWLEAVESPINTDDECIAAQSFLSGENISLSRKTFKHSIALQDAIGNSGY